MFCVISIYFVATSSLLINFLLHFIPVVLNSFGLLFTT